jgi:hypothetical protein
MLVPTDQARVINSVAHSPVNRNGAKSITSE